MTPISIDRLLEIIHVRPAIVLGTTASSDVDCDLKLLAGLQKRFPGVDPGSTIRSYSEFAEYLLNSNPSGEEVLRQAASEILSTLEPSYTIEHLKKISISAVLSLTPDTIYRNAASKYRKSKPVTRRIMTTVWKTFVRNGRRFRAVCAQHGSREPRGKRRRVATG